MSSRRLLAFFVIAAVVSLAGCGGKYDLAISLEGEGEITPGPGIHEYERNTPVTMTVTPAEGWGFAGWGGPNGNMVLDNTIVVDGNKYITAIFAKLQHALGITVQPEGAGTVDVVIIPASRGIEHGQTVRVTAVPNAGYAFGCWNDDANDTDSSRTFTMEAPMAITATFMARVADPEVSCTGGTGGLPQHVEITCATSGAAIRFTTDGVTEPTSTVGTLYLGQPIEVSESTVLKAIACKQGQPDSAVVTYVCTMKAPAPTTNLQSGTHEGTQTVTLASPGMTIRYTLDGTTPSPKNGALYTGPITVRDTVTLKAVSYSANLSPSDVVTRVYTIDHWPARAPMPTARTGLGAVGVGGKIYAIGGFDGTSYLNTVEVYDPNTNTWFTRASMPTARAYLSLVTLDGYIYAIGGRTASQPWTKTVERYDPYTNTWTSRADMLCGSALSAAVEVNGIIHVVGGCCESGNSMTFNVDHQEYVPGADTWTDVGDVPEMLCMYGAATDGNKAYFIGGYGSNFSSYKTLIYDPALKTWSEGAYLPYARQELAAAVLNGRIYVFGGLFHSYFGSNDILDDVRVYDPVSNTWTSGPPMPAPKFLHAAAAVSNRVFVLGGTSPGGITADIRELKL